MKQPAADVQRVFLGLGANVGNLEANISMALLLLENSGRVRVVQVSSLRKTRPVGVTDQPCFLNGAAEIETSLKPQQLLRLLKQVESEVGRKKRERFGPREIDLDILYYGNEVINQTDLIVPHPELERRGFVLEPLTEIAPDCIHPLHQVTNTELFRKYKDTQDEKNND